MRRLLAALIAASSLGGLAALAPAPASAAPVRALATNPVNPTNACGGFKGNIFWSENPITDGGYIHVWGDVWNNKCPGATQYLYLSYELSNGLTGSSVFNYPIGSAGYSPTANSGVNYQDNNESENFIYISVTVCDNYQGWHCGKAWPV
jgi:hypothetical protein